MVGTMVGTMNKTMIKTMSETITGIYCMYFDSAFKRDTALQVLVVFLLQSADGRDARCI